MWAFSETSEKRASRDVKFPSLKGNRTQRCSHNIEHKIINRECNLRESEFFFPSGKRLKAKRENPWVFSPSGLQLLLCGVK